MAKKIFFTLLLLLANSGHAQSLTVEQAINYALANSPAFKASQQEINLAEARRKLALSRLLPLLKANASWARTNDQVAVFGTKLRQGQFNQNDFALNNLNNPDPLNNFNFGLNLYAPLFASGKNWLNKDAAEFSKEGAKKQLSFHRRALRLSVLVAYFTASSLIDQLSYVRQGIAKLKKLEKNYKLIKAPNSATTTSFLLSKSIRHSLEARLSDLQNRQAAVFFELKRLMVKDFKELPKLEKVVLPIFKADQQNETETKRDDYLALKFQQQAMISKERANKRSFLPRVGFFADYDINSGDFDNGEDAYSLGFLLSWDIFDYSRYGLSAESRAQRQKLDYLLKDKAEKIKKERAVSLENLKNYLLQYQIIEEALDSAEKALKFAELRYRQGSLPLKDLSQAISNWVEIELNSKQLLLASALAKADYDFQLGE